MQRSIALSLAVALAGCGDKAGEQESRTGVDSGGLDLKQAVLGLKIANDTLIGSRAHEGRVRAHPDSSPRDVLT